MENKDLIARIEVLEKTVLRLEAEAKVHRDLRTINGGDQGGRFIRKSLVRALGLGMYREIISGQITEFGLPEVQQPEVKTQRVDHYDK